MKTKGTNQHLRKAEGNKRDEFYTELNVIENEVKHYKSHFKDKVVYCNCDDPRVSNFFHFFSHNFERLGLKKLIATSYKNQNLDLFSLNDSETAIKLEYYGDKNNNRVPDIEEIGIIKLKGDGDFRSKESIEILKESDIVVTNPPFSLFREYVNQLVEYEKKFLIIGNLNAITYKEVFSLIVANKIWLGASLDGRNVWFKIPDWYDKFHKIENGHKYAFVASTVWFTNLEYEKRKEEIILYKHYDEKEYPKYDHYDAINVNKVKEIPCDYDGYMGVPITFLNKFNPNQFEIIDGLNRYSILEGPTKKTRGKYLSQVNGKAIYVRIVIKKKQ